MSRKEQYAEQIIAELEKWRAAAWVDDIDESTMQRTITVCQNVVRSWAFDPKKKGGGQIESKGISAKH